MKIIKNIQAFHWSPDITKNIQRISFWISLVTVFLVFYDLGFQKSTSTAQHLITFYLSALFIGCISIGLRYLFSSKRPGFKVKVIDIVILTLFVFLILIRTDLLAADLGFFNKKGWLYLAVFLYFIREFSSLRLDFKTQYFNPAQLFITSFLGIILFGTFLIITPKCYSFRNLINRCLIHLHKCCMCYRIDSGRYRKLFHPIRTIGDLGTYTVRRNWNYDLCHLF